MAETTTAPQDITQFDEMLKELERGQLTAHLSTELRSMVTALLAAKEGGNAEPKGAITLTIGFHLKEEGMISVLGSVRAKHPVLPRQKSVFFPAEDGALSRRHPSQSDLFESGKPKAGPRLERTA